MQRRIVMVIAAIAVIIGLIITQPWTYFVVDEVAEAFPNLSTRSIDIVRNMPEEQRAALLAMAEENAEMAKNLVRAQTAGDVIVPQGQQAMPDKMPDEPIVLAVGSFITIDPIHGAEGTATIYELTDGSRVLRLEDFRSTNGPRLHVFLSSGVPKSTFAGLGEDSIDLGPLKGNVGNQNYEIPDDADLGQYQSVVIYCVPFQVVFSSAELSP